MDATEFLATWKLPRTALVINHTNGANVGYVALF